jgi:ubiquinone/menaquinone biosynthesis C-methylase UbiE
MFSYLYKIFASKNPQVLLLKLLLSLAILYLCIKFYGRLFVNSPREEGFTQNTPYIIKENAAIYDDFYCQIHDIIHQPHHRVDYELMFLVEATQPSKTATILDVGSGTGDFVHNLSTAGYRAYGIDLAKPMIHAAEQKFPDDEFVEGNVLDSMKFESGTFSHIVCSYFTIYEIEDKRTFFRNCYFWLQSSGYLILHLVDPDKFDPISPAAKQVLFENPQEYLKKGERITESVVDFPDFQYKSNYRFGKQVEFREEFVDKTSKNVRENSRVLHMPLKTEILDLAQACGFSLHSQTTMKDCIDDSHQYIYILQRYQGNL